MWFKELTGFHEGSADLVRKNLLVEGGRLRSLVNGKSWDIGTFSTPSLEELRALVDDDGSGAGRTKVAELVGDAGQLHAKAENASAVFQVASQFNLLEMTSPEVTPEEGVGIYQFDPTQGPSCAIACGAGTIFRNYFVQVDGALGQTHDRQIDCLADLGCALGNRGGKLWQMRNGYALASSDGLDEINNRLSQCSASERDALRALLRVGVQKQTQVTTAPSGQKVT